MIHTDQATWDHWNETGEWELFQAGMRPSPRIGQYGHDYGTDPLPPDEFVEWAKPCETCGPFGGGTVEVHTGEYIKGAPVYRFADCPNPDCIGGKQRIAVAVPCDYSWNQGEPCNGEIEDDDGDLMGYCDRCTGGLVTVGHVAVEWGPLEVEPFSTFRAQSGLYLTEKLGALGHRLYLVQKTGVRRIALPPGIDTATLVGQWGIGGKVVKP